MAGQLYYSDAGIDIYLGDCREILPEIDPVEMVCTSPPYGAVRDYGGHAPVNCMAIINLLAINIVEGGVIMWNTADQSIEGSETGESFKQAIHASECGLRIHDTMIYCKEGVSFPDAGRYHPAWEFMFVFSKGKPRAFNPIADRKNRWAGSPVHGTRREKDGSMSRPSGHGKPIPPVGIRFNWWLMNNASHENDSIAHPARMPMAMARDQILSWSNPDETILDPFCGSGTTLVAAKLLGRKAVGIEINEAYCEIAANRLRQGVLFGVESGVVNA